MDNIEANNCSAPELGLVPGSAAFLIVAERQRQVLEEDFNPSHDDQHDDGELARAAAVYALPHYKREVLVRPLCSSSHASLLERIWPWDKCWWKPTIKDRKRELVKAGALIIAELERLQRAEALQNTKMSHGSAAKNQSP